VGHRRLLHVDGRHELAHGVGPLARQHRAVDGDVRTGAPPARDRDAC
jgi:hypothetical protein